LSGGFILIRYCKYSDLGARHKNEDSLCAWEVWSGGVSYTLLAVADGLGGHRAGDIASRLAIERLVEVVGDSFQIFGSTIPQDPSTVLKKAFLSAGAVIVSQAGKNPSWHGMATTLTAALVDDAGSAVIAHAGDSRAYLIGGSIQQITKDHSVVQDMADKGEISPTHKGRHPLRGKITRALGMVSCTPDMYSVNLESGTLLLCSDGLTEGLTDNRIFSIISSYPINAACRELVESAKRASRDNISVVLASTRAKL
jgi:serine/threonine protein phosphatase PrpC